MAGRKATVLSIGVRTGCAARLANLAKRISAASLLALSGPPPRSKAGASSTHSMRFATFGCGCAGCAARVANLAKHMECAQLAQLAGAFGAPTTPKSGSKLHALHTLRDIRLRLCWLCRSAGEPREAYKCVQLAGAFEPPTAPQSGSKLHALHALREVRLRLCCVLRWEISGLRCREGAGNGGGFHIREEQGVGELTGSLPLFH